MYDPVLATAILDRFVHHCSFIVIEGESYRMKERERITRVNKRGRPRKNKDMLVDEAVEEIVSE